MRLNTRRYLSAALGIGIAGLLSIILFAFPYADQEEIQPLAFNHKIHIENAGMNCKDCHVNVETGTAATIPALEVCQTCHMGEPISTSPVEKELLTYVAENKEIPWVQIYRVPAHAYFSHRRHVVMGGLECTRCHGNVAAMTTPVSSRAMPLTMTACMDCHRQHKVTNDCLACHR